MGDLSDRIETLLKYKQLNAPNFANAIGCKTRQSIYDLLSGKTRTISPSIQTKILSYIPELSREWLLYGEGEMLRGVVDEAKKSYTEGVPYYDVDFVGGFDIVENDQTANPEYLISFKAYNHATCWCNVTGHSMEPEINSGDIIALKRIEDFSFLPLGEVYAIVTTNGMRTIKRLGASQNKDCYLLIPSNKSPEYSPQELPKNMIRFVYQVLGCVKRL